MPLERLNQLMFVDIHKEQTDTLMINEVPNELVMNVVYIFVLV